MRGFIRAQYRKLQKEVADGSASSPEPSASAPTFSHILRSQCPRHSPAAMQRRKEEEELQRLRQVQQQWHDLEVIENGGREKVNPGLKPSAALASSFSTTVKRPPSALPTGPSTTPSPAEEPASSTAAVRVCAERPASALPRPGSAMPRKEGVVVVLQDDTGSSSSDADEEEPLPQQLFIAQGGTREKSPSQPLAATIAAAAAAVTTSSSLHAAAVGGPTSSSQYAMRRGSADDKEEDACCECCPCRRPATLMAAMGITSSSSAAATTANAGVATPGKVKPLGSGEDLSRGVAHPLIRRRARRSLTSTSAGVAASDMTDVIVEELDMLTSYPPPKGGAESATPLPFRPANHATTQENVTVSRSMTFLGAAKASSTPDDDDDEIMVSVNDFRRQSTSLAKP